MSATTRTTLAILGAALAGFAGGALVTNDPDTRPPGLESSRVFEDGSWAQTGCIPGELCALPRR